LLKRQWGVIAIVVRAELIVLFSRNGGSREIVIPWGIAVSGFAIDDVKSAHMIMIP
jgi:hypothetical protein